MAEVAVLEKQVQVQVSPANWFSTVQWRLVKVATVDDELVLLNERFLNVIDVLHPIFADVLQSCSLNPICFLS